jgi:hypothetical protein
MWRAFERAGYATTNKIRPAKSRKRKSHKAISRKHKPKRSVLHPHRRKVT